VSSLSNVLAETEHSDHNRQWHISDKGNADADFLHNEVIDVMLLQDVTHTEFVLIRGYNARQVLE